MDDQARAAVFGEISRRKAEIEEQLTDLVAIPSVAGDRRAADDAAGSIAALCADAGFTAELWTGPGPPAIFAELAAPAGAPTVLFYGHYDVQPAEPLDAWTTPPFEPTVRDGALWGRGAGDNKGQFLAHIAAVAALSRTCGCPTGVKLLIEGEEEIGSPGLATLVSEHVDRLACDLAVTADGPYHPGGQPLIVFGVRGLLYVDVELEGAGRDLHSGSNGGVAPAPAIDLVRALSALWQDDGSVAVPGFYDRVAPPTAEEANLGRMLSDQWRALMFAPNLNLAGLAAGYAGDGVKTIIPHRAGAKIDVRLVADQNPDEIFDALTRFLAPRGAGVTRRAAVPPSRTPVDTPWVAPVQRAIVAAWGTEALLQPCLGGTTPDHVFTGILGVPSLIVPYAPADMCHHAPDEHLDLEAFHRGVRTSAALCMELSVGDPHRPAHKDNTSGGA